MRGAAVSAQQRMANIGRSLTPEAAILHHHETRTSARRFGGRDAREESADGSSLIVTLKIGKEKFRQYLKDRKNGVRPKTLQSVPYSHNRSASAISGQGTPAPAGSMGPPLTPNVQNQPLAAPPPSNVPPGQLGRVDAPPPVKPGETQPAPVSTIAPYSGKFLFTNSPTSLLRHPGSLWA
jgi:SWI/SNF-related matrix-associated actin-dependent regulator of chromatin subfamily B protein 1